MQDQLAVLAKYAGIEAKGRAAYMDGTVGTFKGFPASLRNRATTVLLFDSAFVQEVNERVILPLSDRVPGIKVVIARRDFPLHTTILECESTSEIIVRASSYVPQYAGQVVIFDRLMADAGGSVIIAATDIPQYILDARKAVAASYTADGYKPLFLDNMLHSSLVRVTCFPSEEARLAFLALVAEISANLKKSPITARIEIVVHSQSFHFLTEMLFSKLRFFQNGTL